jgi:GNAT superfamily N-acetyltransferase
MEPTSHRVKADTHINFLPLFVFYIWAVIMTHTSFAFAATQLQTNDINDFLVLQSIVRNSLSTDTRHYIKPRSKETLNNHLSSNMPILGLKHVNTLVAVVLLTHSDNKHAQNLDGYPFDDLGQTNDISVIQSLYVNPHYQGQSLSTKLIKLSAEFSKSSGRNTLIAKAASNNSKSQRAFLKNGFNMASHGVDQTLGHDVVYMRGQTSHVLGIIHAKEIARQNQTALPVTHDRLTM